MTKILTLITAFCGLLLLCCCFWSCDHGLSPTALAPLAADKNPNQGTGPTDTITTGLAGRVHFVKVVGGDTLRGVSIWPENIVEVYVIAVKYPYVSHLMNQDFAEVQLPNFVDSADYIFPLQPDSFQVVGVVGRTASGPNSSWTISSQLGYFPNPANPASFGPQKVVEGVINRNINLVADFGRWH